MSAKIISFIFIYAVTFWVVIFCILPINITKHDGSVRGADSGAPANPDIKKKFLYTAIVTFVLVLSYFLLKEYGIIDLDHWVMEN